MKKTFYMLPRQCGKTTMAIMEFLRSPETTLIITFNQKTAKDIQNKIKQTDPNISQMALDNILPAIPNIILNRCTGKSYDKVIFDEYMSFKDNYFTTEIMIYLQPCLSQNSELIIYSSADRVYSKKVFDFLRNMPNMSMAERLKEHALFSEEEKADFDRLNKTFLSDLEFKIITSTPYQYSVNYHKMKVDREKCIGKEAYDMEISNIFLK